MLNAEQDKEQEYVAYEARHDDEGEVGRDENGYSEVEDALDREMRAGEWQNLGRFKVYHQRSRQWRIIATYQAINNRLNQLTGMYYKLVGDHPSHGESLLKELQKLRLMQEILLQCMVWEPKGELEKDMVPKEVWDLIE